MGGGGVAKFEGARMGLGTLDIDYTSLTHDFQTLGTPFFPVFDPVRCAQSC